jgi:hypothetical protein
VNVRRTPIADECVFSVTVDVRPLWIRPAESRAQEAMRKQVEARLQVMNRRLEKFLEKRYLEMMLQSDEAALADTERKLARALNVISAKGK